MFGKERSFHPIRLENCNYTKAWNNACFNKEWGVFSFQSSLIDVSGLKATIRWVRYVEGGTNKSP